MRRPLSLIALAVLLTCCAQPSSYEQFVRSDKSGEYSLPLTIWLFTRLSTVPSFSVTLWSVSLLTWCGARPRAGIFPRRFTIRPIRCA